MVKLYLYGMMNGKLYAGQWENATIAARFAASIGCTDYAVLPI